MSDAEAKAVQGELFPGEHGRSREEVCRILAGDGAEPELHLTANRVAMVRIVLRPHDRGRVHDLGALANDVNRSFFSGQVKCRAIWGKKGTPRRRRVRSRCIRFGSWDAVRRTVRVHPALDDRRVPEEFVRYILFHEMLHAVVAPEGQQGRRVLHGRTFRSLERSYPALVEMKRLSRSLVRDLR